MWISHADSWTHPMGMDPLSFTAICAMQKLILKRHYMSINKTLRACEKLAYNFFNGWVMTLAKAHKNGHYILQDLYIACNLGKHTYRHAT